MIIFGYDEKSEGWKELQEPFATLIVPTEKLYDIIADAIELQEKLGELGTFQPGKGYDFLNWMNGVNDLIERYVLKVGKKTDNEKYEELVKQAWDDEISPDKFIDEYNKLMAEDGKEPGGFEPHEHI